MPAALVGTVILTLRGRGVGRTELIRRVEWLTRMIHAKKGPVVVVPEITTEELVDRAISIHPDLIGMQKDKDILEPTFYGIDRFELSYYRNQVIHLFIDEGMLTFHWKWFCFSYTIYSYSLCIPIYHYQERRWHQ